MGWKVKFAKKAWKMLDKLDKPVIDRILQYMITRVLSDPRALGDPLKGKFSDLWRYRVGDYRIICSIEDEVLTVLVVYVGHRREVYMDR